ncbi:MAG: hypothetical protein ABI972_29480 [Acidobacteriota bacterium]
MRLTQQLSVAIIPPSTNETEPTCRILHDSRDTGLILPGAILEAAVELPAGWLVFLTHDVPYEEALEISLVSPDFALLDRARISAPYATAVFANLENVSPTILRFDFLGDRPWRLELLDSPGFRLPLLSKPAGVQRPMGFSRRFRVSH